MNVPDHCYVSQHHHNNNHHHHNLRHHHHNPCSFPSFLASNQSHLSTTHIKAPQRVTLALSTTTTTTTRRAYVPPQPSNYHHYLLRRHQHAAAAASRGFLPSPFPSQQWLKAATIPPCCCLGELRSPHMELTHASAVPLENLLKA
ncbi:hypothetical protein E2C01_084119 [Portunus trituberculatus]|uniref:Uncharacterized protein n=1 Tax=Portunus trituberculatus TaxID=210409 RepID=A0A5B7J9U7_PORTR|nr:hypothetical protein [Portunus trituberculatus]